jgi:adenine-specific DNA methylase
MTWDYSEMTAAEIVDSISRYSKLLRRLHRICDKLLSQDRPVKHNQVIDAWHGWLSRQPEAITRA